MKTAFKRFLTVAFSFVFAFVILFAAPTVASAASDATEDEKIVADVEINNGKENHGENTVYLTMEGFEASTDSILRDEVYSVDVTMSGAGVSSFSFIIHMPRFVSIHDVSLSEELQNVDNSLFDSNIDENTISVYAAYSSATENTNVTIMTVYFSFSYIEEAYETPYFDNTVFTNIAAEQLYVESYAEGFNIYNGNSNIKKGDADLDGEITLADIMVIMRSIVTPDSALSYEQFENADIDRNGTVDIIDCQYIQNYLAGIIDSLENIKSDAGCSHEKRREMQRLEATCSNDGFVEYYCVDCDSYFTETLYATGEHVYDENGICENCGAGSATEDSRVYETDIDGKHFIFYKNYTCECIWVEKTAEGIAIERKESGKWTGTDSQVIITLNDGTTYTLDIADTECPHYNREETKRLDATCNRDGFVEYYCSDCDSYFSGTLNATGEHVYGEDGVCENCGQQSAESSLIYKTTANEITFLIYSDGKCVCVWNEKTEDGQLIPNRETVEWKRDERGYIVMLNGMTYVFSISLDDCEHSNFKETARVDATCIDSGYVEYYCSDCDSYFNETLPSTGEHFYNDNGVCENCGHKFGEDEATEITISDANSIGRGLTVIMSGEEYYTITGTVTEINNDYNIGVFRVENEDGYGVIIYTFNSDRIPAVGETVTVSGNIMKIVVDYNAYAALGNVELTEMAETTPISDVRNASDALWGSSATTETEFIVTGTISQIDNETYGNLYITDGNENYLYIYGLYDTNGNGYNSMSYQPRIGDEITVKGAITKYTDSAKTFVIEIKSAVLTSVNGVEHISIEEANKIGESLNVMLEDTVIYTVGGYVYSIENPQYGKMYIVDDNGNQLLIYGFKNPETVTDIKEGTYITVSGIGAKYYNANDGIIVIEMKNACLVEVTEDTKLTSIPDFIASIDSLYGSTETTAVYEISGRVSDTPDATYGNLHIVDDYGNTLYIYGLYDQNGNRYDSMDYQPQSGDFITIRGSITSFLNNQNTIIIEVKNAVVLSVEKGTIEEIFPVEGK